MGGRSKVPRGAEAADVGKDGVDIAQHVGGQATQLAGRHEHDDAWVGMRMAVLLQASMDDAASIARHDRAEFGAVCASRAHDQDMSNMQQRCSRERAECCNRSTTWTDQRWTCCKRIAPGNWSPGCRRRGRFPRPELTKLMDNIAHCLHDEVRHACPCGARRGWPKKRARIGAGEKEREKEHEGNTDANTPSTAQDAAAQERNDS